MNCGQCLRWRRLEGLAFGACCWPGGAHWTIPRGRGEPYWRAEHPTGDIRTHHTHGEGCAARVLPRRTM